MILVLTSDGFAKPSEVLYVIKWMTLIVTDILSDFHFINLLFIVAKLVAIFARLQALLRYPKCES